MTIADTQIAGISQTRRRDGAVRGRVTVITILLLVVSLAASAATLWWPRVLTGPAAMNGSARGTALVVLLIALPITSVAVVLSRRGARGAGAVWLGGVAYLGYNAGLFLFATPYNRAFLLYVAMLGLAVWTFGGLLTAVRARGDWLPGWIGRLTAGYLWLVTALTAAIWMRGILPSITAERPAAVTDGLGVATNPVYIQDLALGLPAAAVTAVLLWRRRPGSGSLTIAVLTYWAIESVSIAVDQWFAVAADPGTNIASATVVPVFAVLTVIDVVVLAAAVYRLQVPPGRVHLAGRQTATASSASLPIEG